MLLLDDNDELPDAPTVGESSFVASLTVERFAEIDAALTRSARTSWLKVARIVHEALEAGGFSPWDDGCVHLHVRRVGCLVSADVFDAKGDLRRPRWSEVRLRERTAV
jgi:hypothetical protein